MDAEVAPEPAVPQPWSGSSVDPKGCPSFPRASHGCNPGVAYDVWYVCVWSCLLYIYICIDSVHIEIYMCMLYVFVCVHHIFYVFFVVVYRKRCKVYQQVLQDLSSTCISRWCFSKMFLDFIKLTWLCWFELVPYVLWISHGDRGRLRRLPIGIYTYGSSPSLPSDDEDLTVISWG